VLSDNGRLQPEHLRLDRPRVTLRSLRAGTGGNERAVADPGPVRVGTAIPPPATQALRLPVGGLERELIEQVIRQCDGVKVKAADRLGINRNTLHKKLEEFDTATGGPIDPPEN